MSDWQINVPVGGSYSSVEGGSRNVIGSPLVSATKIAELSAGSLPAIAGVYRFKFETTSTVSCVAFYGDDQKNPLMFETPVTVVTDGETPNRNILPGWEIKIYNPSADDVFEVGVGCIYDTSGGTWIRSISIGRVFAGMEGREKTLYAYNNSGSVQCNTKITVVNGVWVVNGTDYFTPFLSIRQGAGLSPTSHSDLDGEAVTFANYTPGSPSTVDILIESSTINVYDVANDTDMPNGTGLNCDGVTVYRFADGTAYQGVEFILSTDIDGSDTATIYVSDGADFIEVSNGDGTWVDGSTGVYVNTSGAGEGVVDIEDNALFLIRSTAPAYSTTDLNMRFFAILISGEGV